MRLLSVLLVAGLSSLAAVERVYVLERSDVLNGKAFGSTGPYEEILAEAHFSVDPKLKANRIVTDVELASLNSRGLVEFSVEVMVMRPRDPARGNGTVLCEIPNRGGVGGVLGMFNMGSARRGDFGDELLMREGYTLVWVGWEWDVPRREGLLRLRAPVARNPDGSPIRGPVRAQFVPNGPEIRMPLGDRDHIAYAPVNPEDPKLELTVRDSPAGPRSTVPRSAWKFNESLQGIEMLSGFMPGRIYEIVYEAEDPVVAGLGLAAVRDFVSFLKYGAPPETMFSEEHRSIKRSIGFGTSQSGRFLRQFLYDGFNADERGRKVFDGVWAHVAGAGRGDFNLRFAQASRDGHPRMNLFYPVDLFPFTGAPETDPESGRTEGLLDRARQARVEPKFFETVGSYEYWGRAASLIHTTPNGSGDAPAAEDTHIYFLTGTQHGPASTSRRIATQNYTNPADYRWALRALLAAMNTWLRDDVAPPASRYPRLDAGTLTDPSRLVRSPAHIYVPRRLDFGPRFLREGIMDIEPPKLGSAWPVLVPQVDADGNELAGVRLPHVAVPLGTYTGWNPRAPVVGAPDTMADLVGSYIPFTVSRSERLKAGDTRRSISERYHDKQDYIERVTIATGELVRDRFVLPEDAGRILTDAAWRWDQAFLAAGLKP
jgi:Alpha/beta hydrolase domain